MKTRTFLIILGLCALIWGVIGIYSNKMSHLSTDFKSTDSPTASVSSNNVSTWETFSTTTPDYYVGSVSIRYPSTYQVWSDGSSRDHGQPIILAQLIPPDYVMEFSTSIILGVQESPFKTVDDLKTFLQPTLRADETLTKVTVNGYEALKSVLESNEPGIPSSEEIYIPHGGGYLYLIFEGPKSDPNYPDFTRMLETVKF